MIQGIRITSQNLSGDTANVTFNPQTGGTINLGTQTIPFNNITNYPYGTYELFVPEFNYTYDVIVPAPQNGQDAYTTTVRDVTIDGGLKPFSGAVLSEVWGTYTTDYITNQGIPSTSIVLAEGICSDDVDAPAFQGINNIGQFPTSTNSLLGPFMSGGLAGFPFVGQVGLGAWASHITTGTTASGGTLFITSTPHIGITSGGSVGQIFRRGNVSGTTPSSTCGAVAGAISVVTTFGATEPQYSGWTGGGDYEFYYLQTILWPERAVLSGMTYGNAMKYATETIRDSAKEFLQSKDKKIE